MILICELLSQKPKAFQNLNCRKQWKRHIYILDHFAAPNVSCSAYDISFNQVTSQSPAELLLRLWLREALHLVAAISCQWRWAFPSLTVLANLAGSLGLPE